MPYIQIVSKTAIMPIRVTQAEKDLIRERAEARGLTVSDYVRQAAMGVAKPGRLAGRQQRRQAAERGMVRDRAAAEQANLERSRRVAPGDLEALVERYSRTMPRRNAEIVARRELGRG